MRRLFVAGLVALLFLAACTKSEKTPGPDTPSARRDPAVAPDAGPAAKVATRDLTSWVSDWPRSWTDPRVLAVLAEDCSFVPVRPVDPKAAHAVSGGRSSDIFTCRLGYDQSCTVDPCLTVSGACEGKCETTCGDCGGGCVTSCNACKTACTDDACKKACAATCGECKQACNRTMDRCVSGACAKAHEACGVRLDAMWKRSGCKARCAVFGKCRKKCGDDYDDAGMACRESCEDKVSPGFRRCNAKCDDLRTTKPDGDDAELCLLKCYETEPCSATLCDAWAPTF